jgi:hypothetical protein
MSASSAATPDTNLANLVLALLAPMFLWSTAGDIRLAYTAAAQTLNEYRVANRLSLVTVAKIVAFDIATLSSLSLSMYEDVSMSLALRLRGNANSLDRSAERNRRLLELQSRADPAENSENSVEAAIAEVQRMVRDAKACTHASAPAAETQPDAEPAAVTEPRTETAPAPVSETAAAPAARTGEQQHRAAWAHAMTVVTEEFAAALQDLPPEERWPEERLREIERIEALTTIAGDLVSGTAPPPLPAIAAE